MTKAEQARVTAWRLKVLRWAQGEPRQVARTCRHSGISRTAYYRWKRRFEAHVDPFELGEPQGATDDRETVVYRVGGSSLLSLVIDPRIQRAAMDALQGQVPDPRHQLFEQADVPIQRTLVLVLANELDRRFLETSFRPDAVDPRLARRLGKPR